MTVQTDTGWQSEEQRNVIMGLDDGWLVKAVIWAMILRCGDGALLSTNWNRGTACVQSSWRSFSSESARRVNAPSSKALLRL